MYQVAVTHKKEMTFGVSASTGNFTVDAAGKDGVTPPDALLAALATCVGVYIRKYAHGASLSLENFSVSAQAEFTKEPPYCFKEIGVTIDLAGASLDERRKKALLEFIKNCPVHNTLKAVPAVTVEIK
jgi:uncharacterized OsmC-like protein